MAPPTSFVPTPQVRADLEEYWRVYERHHQEVNDELTVALAPHPEFGPVLRMMSPEMQQAQNAKSFELQRRAVIDGDWEPYLADAREQGATYAKMGISFGGWFEVIAMYRSMMQPRILAALHDSPERLASGLNGMGRLLDLAMSVIGEAYLDTKEGIIGKQRDAIAELSTPVLQIRDRLLMLPVIGVIDTHRARQLTTHLLGAIRSARAKAVVMDVTGVPAVDSRVANHLLQTVEAARLMGATVIVTGLSAEVAQAVVALGVDLGRLVTIGDLQEGIEVAERVIAHQSVARAKRSEDAP